MSREEKIKVLNKYKSHNYDTLEFEDDEDIIEMCLKENQALEETIQDLKKLDEIEKKLWMDNDLKLEELAEMETSLDINEKEYLYEKGKYEIRKEILDILGGKEQ